RTTITASKHKKINLGTIKIQLLGVIETVKLINKTDNNKTTQYILQQLQGLIDIIQQDLHVIEITGELPEQHTDRFIKENQEPDLSQYNLATSQNSNNKFINAWEIIKEANKSEPWTNFDTYEEYITQTEKQSTAQILKAKEYFAKELIRIIVKNWKYEYPREQFEETKENIIDLIIKEHDNYELSDLKARIKLAKNELQLPTKEEIEKPTTSRIFERDIQWKDTTIEKKISIPEQAKKYKELREKINNIFDKLSKEGILKTLNQDPFTYTSKLEILAHVQLPTRYKEKLTEAKLPFNKPDELANISPFNGPLFNQLTLMEHLKESLYIRIAANKKNQLTEGQYQDWQQQMFQKIEKQYNILYNEGRQFSLKNIMQNQIKEGYDNLHEMLNHDQLKLNFIAIDRAIVQNVILREEITLQHKDLLKMFYANPEKYGFALQLTIINEWNMMYQQLHRLQLEGKIPNRTYIIEDRTMYSTQFFTEEIITNQEEKEKLNQLLQYSTFKLLPNKMNYTIFCDPGQEQMLQWFKKRSKEGNKGTNKQIPKEYLIKIYNKYREIIKQVHPNYIRINNNIPNLEHMFRTLFIHEMNTNFEEYNEEKIYRLQEHWDYQLEPQLAKISIKLYTVFIPFTLQNQKLNVTIYPNQFETLGGSIEETNKGIFEAAKRECKEETSYEPEDTRIQLILNHQYLSNNKNGTRLFIRGLYEYTQ
ncbi:27965_t:CDS:2, partial [Gigaspora margarita]